MDLEATLTNTVIQSEQSNQTTQTTQTTQTEQINVSIKSIEYNESIQVNTEEENEKQQGKEDRFSIHHSFPDLKKINNIQLFALHL